MIEILKSMVDINKTTKDRTQRKTKTNTKTQNQPKITEWTYRCTDIRYRQERDQKETTDLRESLEKKDQKITRDPEKVSELTTSKSTLKWEKPKVNEKMHRTSTSKSKLSLRTEI